MYLLYLEFQGQRFYGMSCFNFSSCNLCGFLFCFVLWWFFCLGFFGCFFLIHIVSSFTEKLLLQYGSVALFISLKRNTMFASLIPPIFPLFSMN